MNRNRNRVAEAILLVSVLSFEPLALLAQGSLTPPGPPSQTMKSLDQIEARTPIASGGVIISQPGSYYLTTNLAINDSASAIHIDANQVTLDLNGFTISSSYSGLFGEPGILVGNYADIRVFNGHIVGGVTNNGSGVYSGPGFTAGIGPALFSKPINVRVSNVTVSGVSLYGINLGTNTSTVVEDCDVRTVGGYGIEASIIKSSVATDCGGAAIIGDQVMECRGQSTGGDGIIANSLVQNSYGYANTNTASLSYLGISCNGTAQNCAGVGGGFDGSGVSAASAENCYGFVLNGVAGVGGYCTENCYGYVNSGVGVQSTIALNCYGYSASFIGLEATIATGCHGATSTGTALSVTHNLNSY